MIQCPYCQRADRQVKAGLNKGEQRFKCMYCDKRYIPTATQRAYPLALRQEAAQLHACGMSVLDIGRRLHVSPRNVTNWIHRHSAENANSLPIGDPPAAEPQESVPAPRKSRPTVVDVAERASVSVTTVSNYINDKGGMSKATKARIAAAMTDLHFMPNSLVRAIRQRRTKVLGLLVGCMWDLDSQLDVSLTPHLLAGIETGASAAEHDILIFTGWPRQLRYNGLNFLDGQVDGLIWFAPDSESEILNVVTAGGLPVVSMLTRHVPETVGFVNADNLGAMSMLVEHLIEIGRSRIAYLGDFRSSNMSDRRMGYRMALLEKGLPFDEKLEIAGPEIWRPGFPEQCLDRWLSLPEPPNAIITGVDTLANEIIALIRSRGLRVPEDIAVTGFDDVPAAQRFGGGLTTIHQPFRKIAETAVSLLVSMIDGVPAQECRVTFPTQLIVRASTVGQSPPIS